MKIKSILNYLKWIWFAAVVAAASWYVARNFTEIRLYLATIKLPRLAISVLLLLVGKILTADLTFQSLKLVSHPITFKDAFSVTTITQLGKYLPGGIWHFAGKIGIYRARGLTGKNALMPIVIENYWLIASALITGLSALFFSDSLVPCGFWRLLCRNEMKISLLILVVSLWVLLSFLILRFTLSLQITFLTNMRLSLEQFVIWFLFGISFWIVFPAGQNADFLLQAISAFSVSWAAGYIAFFAPGGIGIREASMAILLSIFFTEETIVVYASLHRILWVIVELILAAVSMLLIGLPFDNSAGKIKEPEERNSP